MVGYFYLVSVEISGRYKQSVSGVIQLPKEFTKYDIFKEIDEKIKREHAGGVLPYTYLFYNVERND